MMTNLLMAALLAAAQPAEADGAIEVLGARFYAQDNRVTPPALVETDRIPHRPGTSCYGWALQVAPEERSVAIRELFDLPAPGQWNANPEETSLVNGNGSSAVTDFQADLSQGVIAHAWCVAEGDPQGPHRIRVYQGERLLHDFRFTVVPETR